MFLPLIRDDRNVLIASPTGTGVLVEAVLLAKLPLRPHMGFVGLPRAGPRQQVEAVRRTGGCGITVDDAESQGRCHRGVDGVSALTKNRDRRIRRDRMVRSHHGAFGDGCVGVSGLRDH